MIFPQSLTENARIQLWNTQPTASICEVLTKVPKKVTASWDLVQWSLVVLPLYWRNLLPPYSGQTLHGTTSQKAMNLIRISLLFMWFTLLNLVNLFGNYIHKSKVDSKMVYWTRNTSDYLFPFGLFHSSDWTLSNGKMHGELQTGKCCGKKSPWPNVGCYQYLASGIE
jgi:hypothetical protein